MRYKTLFIRGEVKEHWDAGLGKWISRKRHNVPVDAMREALWDVPVGTNIKITIGVEE